MSYPKMSGPQDAILSLLPPLLPLPLRAPAPRPAQHLQLWGTRGGHRCLQGGTEVCWSVQACAGLCDSCDAGPAGLPTGRAPHEQPQCGPALWYLGPTTSSASTDNNYNNNYNIVNIHYYYHYFNHYYHHYNNHYYNHNNNDNNDNNHYDNHSR